MKEYTDTERLDFTFDNDVRFTSTTLHGCDFYYRDKFIIVEDIFTNKRDAIDEAMRLTESK